MNSSLLNVRSAPGRRKLYKRVLQVLIIGVIFLFLARNLYQNWGEIATYDWKINYYWLSFSFGLMVVSSFLLGLGWNLILRALGGSLAHPKALKIFFLSELGKYIPGRIWSMVGRVYLCKQQGIPISKTSASVVIQPVIQNVSGVLVFLLSLAFWSNTEWIGNFYPVFFLVPAGLVLLHPAIVTKGLNFTLKKLKRNPVQLDLKYRDMLQILLLWCGLWLLSGMVCYFLIIFLYPLSLAHWLIVAGIFSISGVVAFVSFLTPSGLGVMEGMLAFLLSFYLPLYIATLIALLLRVWRTANDLICVAITSRF
jgi:hypothetical protein